MGKKKKRTVTCSRCLKTGHNVRTCPMPKLNIKDGSTAEKPESLPVGKKTWRRMREKGWTDKKKLVKAIKSRAVKRIKGIGRGTENKLREWADLDPIQRKRRGPKQWEEPHICRDCGEKSQLISVCKGPLCFSCWQERRNPESRKDAA